MARSTLRNQKAQASGKLHDLLRILKTKPRLELLTFRSSSPQPPEVLARRLGMSYESVKRHLHGMESAGLIEMTLSGYQQLVRLGPRMTILSGKNGDQAMLLSCRGHWMMLQTDTNDGCVHQSRRKPPEIEFITDAIGRMHASHL